MIFFGVCVFFLPFRVETKSLKLIKKSFAEMAFIYQENKAKQEEVEKNSRKQFAVLKH
jgi:hypothetical protein